MLAPRFPDATLLIAGDGEQDYVSSLKARADALGLAEQVIWAGRIDGVAKAAALTAATVFALPSHSENFGIAAVEALHAGLPLVLGRGVALSAQVAAAGAGVVVEPEPAAIAAAMSAYLDQPVLRAQAAANARQLAADQFSLAAMGDRLAHLYAALAPTMTTP